MSWTRSEVEADSKVPEGMIEVSRVEFFDWLIRYQKSDPMPNHVEPYYTLWKTKHLSVVGWSYPGWINPGGQKRYAVKENLL